MKRFSTMFIFLCILPMCLSLRAQIKQAGQVTLQNSGRQPLSGVQVRAMGAVPASSDGQGKFNLHFNKARPGQMLFLDEVYKEGYELVNEQTLKQWIISTSRNLPIVMCPKGTLAAAQEKYYEIGKSHNMARYTEACKKLDEQLKQNALSVEQYNRQLDALSKAYQQTMNQLESYAYAMACYNRDELDQMSARALALVEQGDVDGALALYKDAQLIRLYQGLNYGAEQERKDMENMLPSLRLNADICLFAGGEENYQKAENIYRSIALSDTTNAGYAFEYATFLTEQRFKLKEAKPWLQRTLRHSTDSLQMAELYAGLGMITTYTGEMKQSFAYLTRAKVIYTELLKQEIYQKDAYFNMSYASYAINESRYWLASKESANAAEIIAKGVDYANVALQLHPQEYSYEYAFYANEFATVMHELMIQYAQKNDENLQEIIEMGHLALDVLDWVDEKKRIKAAQLKSGIYNLLSTACSNCGKTEQSVAYADSCCLVLNENMTLNSALFQPLLMRNLTVQGGNLIMMQRYEDAAGRLYESYQLAKELPYEKKATLEALQLLAIVAPVLPKEQGLQYSQLAMEAAQAYPRLLAPKKTLDIYWSYLFIHSVLGKDLPVCEDRMLEMLSFIQKEDRKKEWFSEQSYADNLLTMLFALYRHHGKIVTNQEKKREVLQKAIEVIGMYPDLEDVEINQQVIATLWEK